ncbi:type II/IV secretion system protein [Candidatus Gracilibacteria bacterium]|nr:type II/IV secretion system protein [Candidatus Gracilibacteria bacterium]
MQDINKISIRKDVQDVVVYINDLFDTAIEKNFSDIHIETTKDFLFIRCRKDGDFEIYDKVSLEHLSTIVTRLKVLAKVKIDENKKPQDGKIVYTSEKAGETIDIRASTLPTIYGEKVVMRVLRQNDSLINLKSIGLFQNNLEKVENVLKSKYGIILVAGPTGSGKSTTLFSILKNFNPLEYNISTLEDPVEYNIDYVNQSQIKPEIGYTFASGLRSLVRQDPDIIMVGEIRDKETALLSIEAALTGHLVLSTIHTNSASATVQRLINMGIEPFLITSSVKMIISQRLVKRICSNCKKEENINENVREKIKKELQDIMEQDEINNLTFYKGIGCEKCNNTGYTGRQGVHEVLVLGEYLEKDILNMSPASEIHKIAVKEGMITILQDAILKAAMGETTLDEAFKLI